MIDEIKDADDSIEKYKLVFIGSYREKSNFKIFKIPLHFLSDIYNCKISLKEAEISQRNLGKKIEKLKFDHRPENSEEKEEINGVLMQVNGMFENRSKICEIFKDGTFSSEHLKKSDDAADDDVLKDVNNFIQKIESMSENISLSLF